MLGTSGDKLTVFRVMSAVEFGHLKNYFAIIRLAKFWVVSSVGRAADSCSLENGSLCWKQQSENAAVCWNTLRALNTIARSKNFKDWAISRQLLD